MDRPAVLLRRTLTAIVAFAPLLASADVCTVGALTGRAGMACGMESGAPACHAPPAPALKCPHCAPSAPVRETPRSPGPTCCDLRPQASGAAEQPVLAAPVPVAHPVLASATVAPIEVTVCRVQAVLDDDRAPPADFPPLRSPRAPPLG